MTNQPEATVKAFISYSWSSPSHEAWVLNLANRLVSDGIDVILDKWELQPGRDPIAFMEQMVTDPQVKKVVMICDRIYTEKANGRQGGVGKEAQILTAEIYEKTAADKYAAILTEWDSDGKPYVPTYYHSRQYIDFTDSVRQEEKYEELLRWLYDKPQHKKPKLGTAPSFINAPEEVTTATTSKLRQAEHAIKAGSNAAGGAITTFGDALVEEFASRRPPKDGDEPWDQIVVNTAASLRPGLRNLSELVFIEARYGGGSLERILRIYERLGSFMYRAANVNSWSEDDFDFYKMMSYEGMLSLAAILIKEGRFDLLADALNHPYLIEGRDRYEGAATATFRVFCQDVGSFRRRKQRLSTNRIDMYADVIAETYRVSFPTLDQLIEADLVLFLRSQLVGDNSGYEVWWPRTLIYWNRNNATELFARSESRSFWERWAPKVFPDINLKDFQERVAKLHQDGKHSWGSVFGPNISRMSNLQHLCSKP
jgi:hypothetical protein